MRFSISLGESAHAPIVSRDNDDQVVQSRMGDRCLELLPRDVLRLERIRNGLEDRVFALSLGAGHLVELAEACDERRRCKKDAGSARVMGNALGEVQRSATEILDEGERRLTLKEDTGGRIDRDDRLMRIEGKSARVSSTKAAVRN